MFITDAALTIDWADRELIFASIPSS